MDMEDVKKDRIGLKGKFSWLEKSNVETDQMKGLLRPAIIKEAQNISVRIPLPKPNGEVLFSNNFYQIIEDRKSRRNFSSNSISIPELSFLLWSTQGIKEIGPNETFIRKMVPSGGARHTFETYLSILNVDGIEPGIYQYLPRNHEIGLLFQDPDLKQNMIQVAKGQEFVTKSAVTFIWSCIPYRGEWRYHWESHKLILLDAGHLCQNLYLSAEAIQAGTCAIGAYDQDFADKYLHLDGEEEFVIYMAPVGKI